MNNDPDIKIRSERESEKLGDIHDICLAIEVAIMSQ